MAYFQAMGFVPGAVIAAQQGAPLPAPQPAYGTRPAETPPPSSSSASSPTLSPYVPPPGVTNPYGGLASKTLLIGAAIIGGVFIISALKGR